MHCQSRDTADYVKTLTIDDKVDQSRDKESCGVQWPNNQMFEKSI